MYDKDLHPDLGQERRWRCQDSPALTLDSVRPTLLSSHLQQPRHHTRHSDLPISQFLRCTTWEFRVDSALSALEDEAHSRGLMAILLDPVLRVSGHAPSQATQPSGLQQGSE